MRAGLKALFHTRNSSMMPTNEALVTVSFCPGESSHCPSDRMPPGVKGLDDNT